MLYRYYIEYLRLNTVRHIVEDTTQKNMELEEECSLLQHTSAVAEIENESLTKEIARLTENIDTLRRDQSELETSLQDTRYQLEATQRAHLQSQAAGVEYQHSLALARGAISQEQQQADVLNNELNLTRLTCQELVRASALKDAELKVNTVYLAFLCTYFMMESVS